MSKRLMPTYLIKFLENLYNGNRPLDFTRVMVTRQFIAKLKELYVDLGGKQPENYTQILVPKYLQDFFNELEILEFDDDDISQTKIIPSNLVYPACRIDSIGGMSYKSENLIVLNDVAETTDSGITYKVENGILYINGTNISSGSIGITISFNEFDGQYSVLLDGYKNVFRQGAQFKLNGSYKDYININTDTKTLTANFNQITFIIVSNESIDATIKPMIVSGSTALPYQPYFTGLRDSVITSVKSYDSNNNLIDTYTVPSAITSLEGYGQGINSTVYNNVDFANGKYVENVKEFDLTTAGNWRYNSGQKRWICDLPLTIDFSKYQNSSSILMCSKYKNVAYEKTYTDDPEDKICSGFHYVSGGTESNYFTIKDSSLEEYTLEQMLEYVATLKLLVKLATPTETNITENTPLLEVEEGGKVVLENEYNQDVPSEVVTWIKES